ncbi:nuclear transport factor 2 family protein [Williamsia sp. D3]|uniref:nuclear transport factor 2 family protein n=1 Tax=Williamsia sp. D3 TaxID=1313067 RepID=UPI0003D39459|nr:nuclear transport factor 2 family protein [Williamsia sp. D3]ETD33084.1 polyketide cyclase [Williamsia sp. D3]
MGRFRRAELESEFARFEKMVEQVAETHDWNPWAEQFTDDADYVEHAMGTFKGREEIRTWVIKTMGRFPGSHMVAFPALWHVIDEDTDRVICEIDNPLRDPGDGSLFTATNITILTYAGDGLWSKEEDVYNPLEFAQAAKAWCHKAQELGNLTDEAGRWLDTVGKYF